MTAWRRRLLWFLGVIVLLLMVVLVASYWLDEPLRAYIEKRVNENLKGYQVRLEDMDVNLLGPSMVLQGLSIIQEKHPDPPVAYFKSIDFGVQWRAIFSGRLVGQVEMDHPRMHVNLIQLREEAASQIDVEDRGWQAALKSVYPLEINLLTVSEGELVYIDQDPQRPLRISQVAMKASNIRNISSPQHIYPSPFHFEAVIFDAGKVRVDGKANFLEEPHPGAAADIVIRNISLDYFAPILERYRVSLKSGRMNASGELEFAPETRVARLKSVQVQDLRVDYIHTPEAAPAEQKAVQKTQAAAAEVSNDPRFQLRIDYLQVHGETGMINTAVDPDYRIFIANADLRLENLSNHFSQGPADLRLNGEFMGSGNTEVTAAFRAEEKGPDFDLNVKIEGTRLPDMNDLLRAYGNFDVRAGTFSLFAELKVRNDKIDGYVKPIFKNIDVYDQRQDAEKSIFRKLYEGLVGGVSDLLSRGPQDRMAARTDMSGQIENPRADTWQLVLTLIQNAFFKAILPGFDQEISKLDSDGPNDDDTE